MHPYFSFNRWLLLLQRHWIENKKFFLLATLSLLGAMFTAYLFFLVSEKHYDAYSELILYFIGLFLVGSVYASGAFSALQKKERGIAYLTLPASATEKLFTLVFYNLIIFTLVYSLCFYAMTEVFEWVVKSRVKADPLTYSFQPMDWERPRDLMVLKYYFLLIFFGVQALFIAGSVYFKRFSFMLTTIVLVLFILLLGYYLNSIQHGLLKGYYGTGAVLRSARSPVKIYRLPAALVFTLKWIMLIGWAPLFWLVAWCRLKEKEI